MATDWIRGPDDDFDDQLLKFNNWVSANGETYGLSTANLSALATATTNWSTAFTAHKDAQSAAESAKTTKDDARAAAEALMRPFGATLQASAMTNPMRVEAGLTVRKTTHTPAAVPTSKPVLTIDNSQRLQQTIHFRDETTPNSKAKPPGVMGIELRYFCGEPPPADPGEFEFAGIDTATPYLLVHEAGSAGKKCWVAGRWVNTRQEKGPWSETVMATVTA